MLLNRGIHVFCEVPPGRNVKDMQNIIAAEKKAGGPVVVFGFTLRFHGAVLKAKEIIDSGTYRKDPVDERCPRQIGRKRF